MCGVAEQRTAKYDSVSPLWPATTTNRMQLPARLQATPTKEPVSSLSLSNAAPQTRP